MMCDSLSGSVWVLEYCELTVTFDHENLTLHLRVQVIFLPCLSISRMGQMDTWKHDTSGHSCFWRRGIKTLILKEDILPCLTFLPFHNKSTECRNRAKSEETKWNKRLLSHQQEFEDKTLSSRNRRTVWSRFTTTPLKEEERSPTPSFYMVWRVLASSALPLFPLLLFGWLAPGLESCRATVPKTTARVLLFIPPPPPASPLCSTITTTCYFN